MFGATGHLPELIIILILGLVILGPGKLPQVGGAVGKTIREFRKASTESEEGTPPEGDEATAPVATSSASAAAKPAPSTTAPAKPVPPADQTEL
jgi:sec-independent protein translocase protein TatA